MFLGVTIALSGDYGADGLWFEDEEASMSVCEFKYAVYSGKIWNECVELDDELFLIDEGERLWLSILKYFCFSTTDFQFFVSIIIFFTISFVIQIDIYYYISSTFFQQDFEKMKVCPFHRGKVDNLFVVVGQNCICHRCVFGK